MVKKLGVKAVAAGTLIVAGAGYLAGILTAPKSGKDTREDISKKAGKARSDSEKQLKKLHSELGDLVKEADAKTKKARAKASKEMNEATEKAKVAKQKAKEVLSAIRSGEADDPNLQAVVEEVKLARTNLAKYLKKK